VEAAVQERGARPERRPVRSGSKRCEVIHRQNVARSIYTNAVSSENLTRVHGRRCENRVLSRMTCCDRSRMRKAITVPGARRFRGPAYPGRTGRAGGRERPPSYGERGQASRRKGGSLTPRLLAASVATSDGDGTVRRPHRICRDAQGFL